MKNMISFHSTQEIDYNEELRIQDVYPHLYDIENPCFAKKKIK